MLIVNVQRAANSSLKDEQILSLKEQAERQQRRITELLRFEQERLDLQEQLREWKEIQGGTLTPLEMSRMLSHLQQSNITATDEIGRLQRNVKAAQASLTAVQEEHTRAKEEVSALRAELEKTVQQQKKDQLLAIIAKGEREALSEMIFPKGQANGASNDIDRLREQYARRYKDLQVEIQRQIEDMDSKKAKVGKE